MITGASLRRFAGVEALEDRGRRARGIQAPRDDLVEQRGELVVLGQALLQAAAQAEGAQAEDLVAQVAPAALGERALGLRCRLRWASSCSTSASTPSPRTASVLTIGTRQPRCGASERTPRISRTIVSVSGMVGLVDDDDVGDLHDPRLQRLDRVARAGHEDEDDGVGVVDDVDLGLADADGLQEDVVLARGVHEQRGLQRGLAEPAERAAVGHRADEDAGVEEVLGQADAVAEQRAVGEGRGGVDREHRDLALGRAAQLDQRADERRLARARSAGEADDRGLPGVRVDLAHELPAGGVVGLHQRDRAGQRALVAGEESLGERVFGHRAAQTTLASVDSVLTPPRVTGLPPHVRGEPEPRHGGPLVLLRWMRAHRMLTFNYARLLVRLAWLKLRFRGRLKTDGFAFVCPGVTLEIGKDAVRPPRAAGRGSATARKIRAHEGEVHIGAKSVLGQECTISAFQHVSIGRECIVADRVMLIDFDHGVVEVERPIREQGIYKRDVRVGHNVWIGYGAAFLRGVTVGDNSVVGTYTVVNKDVPANAVVAGVPVRLLRMREAPRQLRWE